MDNRYKRLGKNTILMFLGNMGSKLIALLMLPLYTKWLTPAEYGVTDVLTVYATLISAFVCWALPDAIFIFPKNASDEQRKSYFSSGLFFLSGSFIAFLLICIIFDTVCNYFNVHETINEYLWFIYLFIIVTTLQAYCQQFTRAIDKMVVYCGTGAIYTGSVAIFAFILIPSNGVIGYLWSIVIANMVATLYSFFFSKSYRYICFNKINKESIVTMLKYSLPLVPNGIMFWLLGSLNRPMVEHYIGLDANGILAVASKFPGIISMLFGIFSNAWTISMLEEYGKEGFVQFFNTSLRCIMLPTVLGACLLAMFSEQFIGLFADQRYMEAYKYMPIIVMSILFSCMGGFIGGIFAAKKQSKYFFYSTIWGAASSVVTMYLLIPTLKLYGVTISMVISYLIVMLVRYNYARYDLKGFQFRELLFMFILYGIIVVVLLLDIAPVMKSAVYVFVITYMIYRNRMLIKTIFEKLPGRNIIKFNF